MSHEESRLQGRLNVLLINGCIWFLYLFIVAEAIDLLYHFITALFSPDSDSRALLISTKEVENFAPVFLGILIVFELIETLQVYLRSRLVRIQLILLVGLTALTRHLLASDLQHGNPVLNISIAALIVALATAYFLIDRCSPRASSP